MEENDSKYNFIYRELVKNENDILGIIAYSLYKRQKIEFIQNFKNRNGSKDPSDDDLSSFHEVTNSNSQLENYRNQATKLAQNFLEISLEEKADRLEKFYKEKSDKEIKSMKPSFWFGVAQGIVASFMFVLLLGLLVFFTWSLNQGPKQVLEQIFDIKIISAQTVNKPNGVSE